MKSKRFEPIQEIAANSADQLRRAMADAAGYGLIDKPAPGFVVAPVLTVTKANVAEIASTGVDLISAGWLTHSSPALDVGLDIG